MDAIIGLLLLAVYTVCVIVFAAAMTWVVVKLSPSRDKASQKT
ncbi:MAG TPA: hypothetical protein VI142_02220 [Gaiellaceae bacterium]